MAKTLTNIEIDVKSILGVDKVYLTTANGLSSTNRIYRVLAGTFPWPEFRKTKTLSPTTVADQKIYAWTGAETLPTFLDIISIEIESALYDSSTFGSAIFGVDTFGSNAGNTWKLIPQPPSEFEWNLSGRKSSEGVPRYYLRRRFNRHYIVAADYGDETNRWHDKNGDGTWTQTTSSHVGVPVRKYAATANDGTGATTVTEHDSIEFRPAPSTASQAIQATGIVEPTAFTTGSDSSEFLQSVADDAFAYLLSADWSTKNNAKSDTYMEMAERLLSNIWTKEPMIKEKIKGIVNA